MELNPWTQRIVKFSKLCGIWFVFSKEKYSNLFTIIQFTRLFYLFIVTLIMIYYLFKSDFSNGVNRELIFCPSGIFIFSKVFILFLSSQELVILTKKIDRIVSCHCQSWELDILNKNVGYVWKALWVCGVPMLICFILYCFLRSIANAILYSMGIVTVVGSVPLPLSGLLEDFSGSRNIIFLVEGTTMVWGAFSVLTFLGTDGIFWMFIAYTASEFYILKEELHTLKMDLMNNAVKDGSKKLSELSKRHSVLIGLRDDLNKVFGPVYLFQNGFSCVALCIHMTGVIMTTNNILRVTLVFSSVIFFSNNFVSCLLGEFLRSENERLFEALYDLPWYEQNVKFRKILLMMLRQSCKPYTIGYKYIFSLEMKTYQEMVELTFKLFTVFRTVKNSNLL